MQSIIGHRINHFKKIHSTHAFLIELVSKTKPANGIVISADFQSAGVGQFGRNWESAPNENILLSFYLQPGSLDFGQSLRMHFMTTLALYDVLIKHSIQGISAKWPNDLRVHKSKIAGILMRTTVRAMKMHDFIVSIGLNVNQTDFGNLIDQDSTSMGLELSRSLNRQSVFFKLLDSLNDRYKQLDEDPESLKKEYLEILEEAVNPVKVVFNNKETHARIVDFDNLGRIGLRIGLSGLVSFLPHNEIQIVKK